MDGQLLRHWELGLHGLISQSLFEAASPKAGWSDQSLDRWKTAQLGPQATQPCSGPNLPCPTPQV